MALWCHIVLEIRTFIGSGNGWNLDVYLLIGHMGTKFNEISIKVHWFSFNKMYFKVPSAINSPFCTGHYLKQWWLFVNWALRNKIWRYLNKTTILFFQENVFEKVLCKMATILFWPPCVKHLTSTTKECRRKPWSFPQLGCLHTVTAAGWPQACKKNH